MAEIYKHQITMDRVLLMTENEIQRQILDALRKHPKVAWVERVNSGAVTRNGGYIRFGFPGLSDIIGQTKQGAFLAIEVKTDTGKPTPDQNTFLARVDQFGGVSGVARSVEDAYRLLR